MADTIETRSIGRDAPAGENVGDELSDLQVPDGNGHERTQILVAGQDGADEDAALEGTAAAKRLQVPSRREIERGVAQYEFKPAPKLPEPPKKTIGDRLRAYLQGIDPRRIDGSKLPMVLIALTGFTTGLDDAALGLLLPEMFADFKFNLQFMITLGSVFGIVQTLIAPIMGYLSDRVSRVWMLRIGEIMTNSGSMVRGFSGAAVHLVGGEVLRGLGGSLQAPVGLSLFSDYYPSRSRARVISFLSVAGILGGLVSLNLVGNLGAWIGWRATVISTSSVALLFSGLLFLLKEPIRGYWERIEMGASEEVAAQEQKAVSWGEGWRAAWSIGTIRKICYFTPVAASASLISLYLGFYYAAEFGLGPQQRSYIAQLGAVVSLLGISIGAPIADRLLAYKPGRMLALMGTLSAISAGSLVLMAASPNLWISLAISLPISFVGAMFQPALVTLITMVIPPRIRGLGLQVIAPFHIVGLILVPIINASLGGKSIRFVILALSPLQFIGAYIIGSIATDIDRDMRAAKANAMADEEARRARSSGRNKMIVSRDVDVTYDGVQVLFNVDFDVEEGEIVALLGTNGAGKSTLLRAISGIQEASNGAIFLDGQDITHVPPHQNASNGIVMVPGGHAIFPTLTVEENLRTAAWMYREEDEYVRTRTEEVLDFFPRLRERLKTRAGNMSGGEQQMLALGQAFLMRPRILMIDELSLGLAPQIVEQLLSILRAIHQQGTTVLLVEQSVNVALTIAKRAVFMEKGEIRFDGPTEELLRRPDILRSVFIGGAAAGLTGAAAGPAGRKRPGQERETMLEVEHVDVSFGGVQALSDAGVEVAAGEIVGMIGPNGAGKTTLFDVVSGFITEPALIGGTVRLAGVDVSTLSPDGRARAGLGRSFQNARLFPSLTVRENVAVAYERHIPMKNPVGGALWLPQVRNAERRTFRRVDALIETLGLGAYADKFVNELSTGTRRVVDIACIMASDPQVLLLDEPSSGLAQAETEELGPTLTNLVRETGVAVLVIEHDWNLICSISDKLVAMDLGQVIKVGPPVEVVNDPVVVQSYLGASSEALARSGGDRKVAGGGGVLEQALAVSEGARHKAEEAAIRAAEAEEEAEAAAAEITGDLALVGVSRDGSVDREAAAPARVRKKPAARKKAVQAKRSAASGAKKVSSAAKKSTSTRSRSSK